MLLIWFSDLVWVWWELLCQVWHDDDNTHCFLCCVFYYYVHRGSNNNSKQQQTFQLNEVEIRRLGSGKPSQCEAATFCRLQCISRDCSHAITHKSAISRAQLQTNTTLMLLVYRLCHAYGRENQLDLWSLGCMAWSIYNRTRFKRDAARGQRNARGCCAELDKGVV